jgi:multidrug efflux pump subunit AcrA (membrane-fusion protein)
MKKEIALITLSLAALASCSPKYDETTPKMGPVTEAVFASGIIEPKDAYTVTSLSDGFIVRSYVSENDIVSDGQLLFRLDNRQQNTQVAIAETNLQYAKINAAGASSPTLLQIKAQIDAARAKLQTDSQTLQRYEHLYTTNSVSRQDLDNARLNYQSSLSAYQSAVANYNATSDRTRQDLTNSQSQLENAMAGNKYYELLAVGPSKVYQIFKKQGDLVRKGDQVAQLGNPDSIVIDLDVDESGISKIQLGQQVLVELNTEKNKTYEARVSKIYPHFNETSQSYKVEARFLKEMPGLISGTQLQANVITNKKDNAMLVPRAFVSNDNKVMILKGKATDTATITTGIVSNDWVEVLGGLQQTDKIVKPR